MTPTRHSLLQQLKVDGASERTGATTKSVRAATSSRCQHSDMSSVVRKNLCGRFTHHYKRKRGIRGRQRGSSYLSPHGSGMSHVFASCPHYNSGQLPVFSVFVSFFFFFWNARSLLAVGLRFEPFFFFFSIPGPGVPRISQPEYHSPGTPGHHLTLTSMTLQPDREVHTAGTIAHIADI